MPLFVNKVYSKEHGVNLYGYDLKPDTYFGSRYVVTFGLDLNEFSRNEALMKLYNFGGHVYQFNDEKEFLKVFDTNLSRHPDHHKR